MMRPEILRRIQPTGIIDRVRTAQAGIMGQLLQAQRLDRMAEQFVLDGPTVAYSPLQFLMDLRAGIWSELAKPGTAIDIYRRNVHRAYLDNMDGPPERRGSEEVRALVRASCARSTRSCRSALASPATTDDLTKRHLQDCRDEIAAMLDPLVPRGGRAGGPAAGGRGGGAGQR